MASERRSKERSCWRSPASSSRSSSRGRARASKRGERVRDALRPRRSQDASRCAGSACSISSGRRPGISPTSPGSVTDEQRLGVRLGHERERVPDRRHELHLPVQRRGAIRAGRRLHSGSASPVGRRVRRVRQHAGRRHQRRHAAGRRSLPVRRVVLRAGGRVDEPAGACCPYPGAGQPAERLRARRSTATSRPTLAVPWCAIGCGSSPDISTCATTTASPAPIRQFPRTYEQDKVFAKLTWRLTPEPAADAELSRRVLGQPRAVRPS